MELGSLLNNAALALEACAVLSRSVVSDFPTSWTASRPALLSMGVLQARKLEWVTMLSSRGSSRPRDRTMSPELAGGFFTTSTTWELAS